MYENQIESEKKMEIDDSGATLSFDCSKYESNCIKPFLYLHKCGQCFAVDRECCRINFSQNGKNISNTPLVVVQVPNKTKQSPFELTSFQCNLNFSAHELK